MRDLDYVIDENVRIPMRDGITLSARVWMPVDLADPLPAVIEAIPYRKSDGTVDRDATTHGFMVGAGYVCIRVDLRGSGASGGFFDDEYSEQELEDIEDVIAWAVSAPWSNGSAGLMGISWGGINALLTAARRPEGLKAVISAASVIDRFGDDIHFKGGCQLTSNFGWAAQAMSVLSLPPDPATIEGDWLEVWAERLERTVFLPGLWTGEEGMTPYWARTSLAPGAIDIPVLALAGHRDGYRNLPINLLAVAGQNGKALLGPWDHNYPNISSFGPWLDFAEIAVRWWDRWLKGVENGVEADPVLSVFILDGAKRAPGPSLPGHWVSLADWPSSDVTTVALRLTDGGLLKQIGPLSATIEPNLSCGMAAGEFFSRSGAECLHHGEQTRDDMAALCLDSAPLMEELVLLGAAQLHLALSSDVNCGQVVARLCDVAPDGRSRLIGLGMLNLSFRNGFDSAEPMEPGQVEDITIRFDYVGYRIAPGHVLRLALSSSYWPFIWPEPETARLSLNRGTLYLPIFDGSSSASIKDLDAPPEAPKVSRWLRRPAIHQDWSKEKGRHIRRREVDTGKTVILHNGIERSGSMSETLSIDPEDPNSALMEVTWRGTIEADGVSTETVWSTRMSAHGGSFHIWGQLEAFNAGTCIFTRVFTETVSRHIDQSAATGGDFIPKTKVRKG